MTKSDRVGATRDITAALDRLVAALRLQKDARLAAVLHHQLHQAAWDSHSELFCALSQLLRNAQASQVSSYSETTRAQIDEILCAIDGLS